MFNGVNLHVGAMLTPEIGQLLNKKGPALLRQKRPFGAKLHVRPGSEAAIPERGLESRIGEVGDGISNASPRPQSDNLAKNVDESFADACLPDEENRIA